ncbi:hypothetical protein A2W24_02320 [Microgenomates group bacterium RBG_16_45_19]|nr:MAG: hypothetical protein A2W24_02320 [Microgenomates group bacterium RBG_16_45_19]
MATLQTLSCLIHPLVAVFYLTALPLWHRHSTLIKSYLLGIMFILSLWFLMSIPYLHLILDQLALVVSRKQLELPWGWLVLVEEPWLLKIIYLLYLLLSLISFGLVWRHRRYQAAVLSLALLAGWLAGWLGRMVWYWIYLVPPLALTVTFWLPQLTPIKRLLVSLLLISLIAGNWLYSAQRFLYLSHRYKHLDQVLAQVAALIPHHSTVFLSSIPDAYFWLDRNQLTLRASPSNPVAAADLNRVLQTSQYLVFSEDLSRDITDAQVATYLRDHLVVAHQVSNHQGLDLYLAELQP